MRITLISINKALNDAGYKEKIARDGTHFYFYGGSSYKWEDTIVYTSHVSDYSIPEWVEICRLKHIKYD